MSKEKPVFYSDENIKEISELVYYRVTQKEAKKLVNRLGEKKIRAALVSLRKAGDIMIKGERQAQRTGKEEPFEKSAKKATAILNRNEVGKLVVKEGKGEPGGLQFEIMDMTIELKEVLGDFE